MYKKAKALLICIMFVTSSYFVNANDQLQYISPVPNSILNSRETNIIIRQGEKIEPGSLMNSDLIRVIGSSSGEHTGELFLSEDQKTVLFTPSARFEPNETVTVYLQTGLKTLQGKNVSPTTFTFTVTPLAEPIIEKETSEEFREFLSLAKSTSSIAAQTDSLPEDFPEFNITQSGETAAGYLFGSSNSRVEGIGNYFMILENSGLPLFYSQELSAGRFLSTGYFASARPLGPKHQYTWYIKDQTFTVVDSFQMGNGYIADNHDFILLPNGHAIMLAYDIQPVDMSKIIEGGRPDAEVTGSIIQELDVDKNVVYQWRCWDHIPITDSYKDVKKPRFDYIHVNSVELDNDGHILLSCRETSEILKISRETGETIWRMGGKKNEFTIIGDHEENAPRYFKLQHSVRRLPNGNIILFDNGADKNDKQRNYSRAVEYAMDDKNKTATMVWEFRHDPDILSLTGGTVVRLPNGNTSINWGGAVGEGAPAYTEAGAAGELVYEISLADPTVKCNFSRYLWFDLDPTQAVVHYEVMEGNTYDFSEGDSVDTGISIKINTFTGESYNRMTVKRELYGPLYPEFVGRAPKVFPVRVRISAKDIITINADVTFDLEHFDFTDPDSLVIFHREFAGQGLFIPLATRYNRVTDKLSAAIAGLGELVVGKPDFKSIAYAPMLVSPADSAEVNYTLGVNMVWTPVGYVNEYRVQVSKENAFVDLTVDEQNLTAASFKMDSLENNATYFWHVRSINDAGESDWSETGIFETISPNITVTIPNGGENWQVGLEYRIGWDDNISEPVIIELLQNDETVAIIDTTSSSGIYNWEVDPNLTPGTDYKIKIKSLENVTLFDMSDVNFALMDTTQSSVKDRYRIIKDYALYQNYPNPFNASTHIVFNLPTNEYVSLRIYDMLGREIMTLVEDNKDAGSHSVTFDGRRCPSGIFFYKLETPFFAQTRKMILMK